jgi:hypothetical protein
MDAVVTRLMPWIRALPDFVALFSLSTELGDVKICLNAWVLTLKSATLTKMDDGCGAYPYKKFAPEKAVPGVISVVFLVSIQ